MMAGKKPRPVVRVDVKTGEAVWFPTAKSARISSGVASIGMELLTNRAIKGYRFFYEEDWHGGDSND